jgi:hypothetical protein
MTLLPRLFCGVSYRAGTAMETGAIAMPAAKLPAFAAVKRQREMGRIGSQQPVRGMLNKDRATMLGAISAAARDRH